ncbi:leucine-rich single-pass membrane protein 1 isoform X2 [Latimeria chalumnae]|uniref:leucine-rich single-pass membrane protein 1 isoform X2 n=1 Tax=Latimeria chalumnae TaxID=7897 RepID=UPI0006D8EAEA|nr:PREDICTED: leucine-rich single-pass membrane protein 1 isoform X2 [Latimeria chalumnae]|eukprot:XP_014346037.1 PREDICTED: leucine-rich single-pass membrane protein 1 isoform X2 [Latimeria chalumnae]
MQKVKEHDLKAPEESGVSPEKKAAEAGSREKPKAGAVSRRCECEGQFVFLILLTVAVVISLALISFMIFLIIQREDKLDEVLRRVMLGGKDIEGIKNTNNFILKYLNQTGASDNRRGDS